MMAADDFVSAHAVNPLRAHDQRMRRIKAVFHPLSQLLYDIHARLDARIIRVRIKNSDVQQNNSVGIHAAFPSMRQWQAWQTG